MHATSNLPDITTSPARCVGGFICIVSHAVLIAAMAAHLSRGRAICRLRIREIWPDCASTALRGICTLHVAPSGDLAPLCVNRVVGHLHFACCYFRRFGPAMRQPHCGVICPLHVVLSGDLALLCVNHVAGHLHFARRSFRRLVPVVRQLRCGAFALLHVAPSGDLISLCADHAAGNLHIWHCSAPQLQQQ